MPSNLRRKWVKRFGVGALLLTVLWLLASYVVVHEFTRRARPMFAEPPPSFAAGTIEPLHLKTSDCEQIGAWFIAGNSDRPVVLLLHGNGASRAACMRQAELVASVG